MSDSGDTETEGSTANLAEGGGKSDSKKKIIRLLTVMAYVSSVSGAAFMLSMYYLFLWEPKVAEHHLRADPNAHQALALQGHHGGAPPVPRDYWQLGPHEAHSPYRPPGTPEAFPMGSYRPAGLPSAGHQRPYQDLPPIWMHAAPQPPRPPSLSQVRAEAVRAEAVQSVLLDRIAALSRGVTGPTESAPVTPTLPATSSLGTPAPVTLHRRRPILRSEPDASPVSVVTTSSEDGLPGSDAGVTSTLPPSRTTVITGPGRNETPPTPSQPPRPRPAPQTTLAGTSTLAPTPSGPLESATTVLPPISASQSTVTASTLPGPSTAAR